METEIEKMSLESKDLVAERIEQMKALFPEIITEGEGSIDFEKLRLILGDEVDEGQERYAFTWPGKADAIRQAQIPSTATLRPDRESSVDWDTTENLYIEGDNLEVLKLLQRGYHGKVKMIYIDPPYNTGHDFVYKDSFQDSIENYKEQAGLSGQSNADTSGRYHSDWLSMMYPRLRLARELLSEDGVVFISIDENEVHNARKLCDELFGESNFVSQLGWQKVYSPKNQARYFSNDYEFVLCYCKNINCFTLKSLPRTDAMNARYKNPDNDPRGDWKAGDCVGNGVRTNGYYDIVGPTGKIFNVPQGKHWVYAQDNFMKMIEEGRVWFGKNGDSFPAVKQYLSEVGGRKASSLLLYEDYGHTDMAKKDLIKLFSEFEKVPFDTPKPIKLIKMLTMLGTDEDAIVLDFFAGSGTTAQSIIDLNKDEGSNRRFVLVQLPEQINDNDAFIQVGYSTISDITQERIRRAGQKIKTEIEEENKQLKLGEKPKKVPDIGFRVLKLDRSSFDKVEGGSLVESIVKADRTHEDIIFEMMVKWGLDLSLPMEETEVLGYPITSIAADELICCMNEGLTIDVLEAIAALEPKRVFFLDTVLTDTVKLNAAQIFKRANERMGIEIELRTV